MMVGMSKNPSTSSSNSMGNNSPMIGSDDENEQDGEQGMGGKLLALQNLLDAISQLSDEEIQPDIERLKNQVHMEHESAEGDNMGTQEAQGNNTDDDESSMMDNSPMGKKPGIGVEIGIGGPKGGMSQEDKDEEDESGMPKDGFLAILSKKMKKGK